MSHRSITYPHKSTNDDSKSEDNQSSALITTKDPVRSFLLGEANLAYLPWVSFDRGRRTSRPEIAVYTFREIINGTLATCTLSISAPKLAIEGKILEATLPTQFDYDVFLCITDMWDEQGRNSSGEITFRISDICNRLQINKSGGNYQLVKTAVIRLSSVIIRSENAFYSANSNIRLNDTFNLMRSSIADKANQKVDLVRVKLSDVILDNLQKNYTTRFNRIAYQQLENGFAKRIFALVTHKEQIYRERGSYDFDLWYLAELLPIRGVTHTSTIKVRLKRALEELQAKNIFHFDYVKSAHKQGEILRIIPISRTSDLLGPDDVPRFLGSIYELYGKSLPETLSLSKEDIIRFLKKNQDPPIVIDGVAYHFVFHSLHILFHQKCNGWKSKSLNSVIAKVLKTKKIDEPIGWKPLHQLKREILKKATITASTTFSKNDNHPVKTEIERISEEYFGKLSEKQIQLYCNEIQESNPIVMGSMLRSYGINSNVVRSHLIGFIKRDIIAGKPVDLKLD